MSFCAEGKPIIAYSAWDYDANAEAHLFLKVAIRENSMWSIQTLKRILQRKTRGIDGLALGEFKGGLTIAEWPLHGGGPQISTFVEISWKVVRVYQGEEEDKFQHYSGDVLFSKSGTLNLLGYKSRFEENTNSEDHRLTFHQFNGEAWSGQTIEALQTQYVTRHLLAKTGDKFFASYSKADDNDLYLARSGEGWEITAFNSAQLMGAGSGNAGELNLVAMAAFDEKTLGLLAGTDFVHYSEVTFPSLCYTEEVSLGSPCALAFDNSGTQHIVFVNPDGKLSLAVRKRSAQLSVSQPQGGVLRLPPAKILERIPSITFLPEKVYPGSEQARMQQIAALGEPEKFTLQVDGNDVEFTRWGSGEKAVVFFSHPPEWDQNARHASDQYDATATSISANIEAYASLLESGYSVIVWDYPENPHGDFDKQQINEKNEISNSETNYSGIATALIDQLREKAGIRDFVLVGNEFSGMLLLADLTTLEKDEQLQIILISPNFSTDIDLAILPQKTTAVLIANPHKDWWQHHNPKVLEWLNANRSEDTDKLAPGGGHVSLGDTLRHAAFARWILNSR